jgi:DivIVA domain-containing protein
VTDDATESMAKRIKNAQFKTTRLSAGYDEGEVDTFLDEAIEAIRRGQQASMPPRFSETRLRPGYVKEQVDALVGEILQFTPPLR